MNLFRWVLRPYLQLQYLMTRIRKTGPFGPDRAVYLESPAECTGNPLKCALFRYHVRQFHESSCSVATMATVVNALLDHQGAPPMPPLIQMDLLEKVRAGHWKERMGPDGYKGRRGLPFSLLGEVVRNTLAVYGIAHRAVEVVQVPAGPDETTAFRNDLRFHLEQFESHGNAVIIAHFDQGVVLPELHIPHISPVGGFDPASGTVTLLDVDNSQPHPYRVPFDRFFQSLASSYNPIFRRLGYGRGGYVRIRL